MLCVVVAREPGSDGLPDVAQHAGPTRPLEAADGEEHHEQGGHQDWPRIPNDIRGGGGGASLQYGCERHTKKVSKTFIFLIQTNLSKPYPDKTEHLSKPNDFRGPEFFPYYSLLKNPE